MWYHLGNNGTNWGNRKSVNEGAKVDKGWQICAWMDIFWHTILKNILKILSVIYMQNWGTNYDIN